MSETPIAAGYRDWVWTLAGCRWYLHAESAPSVKNLLYLAPRQGGWCIKLSNQRLSDSDFVALSRIVLAKLAELEAPHE